MYKAEPVKSRVMSVCIVWFLALCSAFVVGCHAALAEPFPDQLTIVCSGELNGKLEPADCPSCGGGLARRHTLIRSIRLEQHPLVLLENGDLIQGTGREDELRFQTAILAMNEMGYDALNIGELDVRLGARFLTNMAERASFPFISANLADSSGARFFPAYRLLERVIGGKRMRIAVIGVLSNRVSDYLARQHGLDVTVLDVEHALRTTLNRVKDQADFQILLAHASPREALSWAEKYPELDVIVYSHEASHPAENERSTEKQIVVNAGKQGQNLARIDLFLDESFKKLSHRFAALLLSDRIPDSPIMRKILDCAARMMLEHGGLESKSFKEPFKGGFYIGSERCAECHLEQFQIWSKSYHSKAFAPLENQGKHSDPACLRCHTTGYRFFTGFSSAKETPTLANVGCEQCHGVGSNHALNPTKRYGKTRRADCKSCHDTQNSPRFSRATYYKKIAHKEQRTKES